MRKIIKGKEIVDSDWLRVDHEEALPNGNVIVPWKRWKAERETLANRENKPAVYLEGDDSARELAPHFDDVAFIAVDFPKFADGRGYSHARILRDELGYIGELRAIGDILRDQVFYLARCGFDALEIREDKELEDALQGFNDFRETYQAAADTPKPIYRRS